MDSATWERFYVCRQFCWTALGFCSGTFSLLSTSWCPLILEAMCPWPLLWGDIPALLLLGTHLWVLGSVCSAPRVHGTVVMRGLARLPREVTLSGQALMGGRRSRRCGGLCSPIPAENMRMVTCAAPSNGGSWFYPVVSWLLANCLALLLIVIWEVTGPLKII